MQPQKLKTAFLVWFMFFLLHQQRALLLHQAYHFPIVEEEFRIRRRNQRRSMLMFFSQMNQQNTQRRRRRAWLRPHPQNWFRSFMANPALNFPWKEHFHVLESQVSSKLVVQKMMWVLNKSSTLWYLIKKCILIEIQFPEIVLIVRKWPVRIGWTQLGNALLVLLTLICCHGYKVDYLSWN